MTLSAVDWGQQLSRSLGADKAVAVFHTPDLTLMWSNDAYRNLLDEPYRSSGSVGLTLHEYSCLEYATRAEVLKRVGSGGEPETGEERLFSVEDGTTIFRWSIHPVCPHHAIEVVDIQLPRVRTASQAIRAKSKRAKRRYKSLDALSRLSRKMKQYVPV